MWHLVHKNVVRLFRHDTIRALKILEILQYAMLASLLSLGVSYVVNKYAPKLDKKKSRFVILLEILAQLAVLIFLAYYITKIVEIIPFVGQGISSKYIPSKKGEAGIGVNLGLAYIYVASQVNLNDKIYYLIKG
tara:strand:+ start:113 stop:514 length:402 start_codon:yes stop_codon:yes gene_type:complete